MHVQEELPGRITERRQKSELRFCAFLIIKKKKKKPIWKKSKYNGIERVPSKIPKCKIPEHLIPQHELGGVRAGQEGPVASPFSQPPSQLDGRQPESQDTETSTVSCKTIPF